MRVTLFPRIMLTRSSLENRKDETEEKEEGEEEESDDEGDVEWQKELMQILVKRTLRTRRRMRMF